MGRDEVGLVKEKGILDGAGLRDMERIGTSERNSNVLCEKGGID